MITISALVYVDKKDEFYGRYLAMEMERFIREHCDRHMQTFVADMRVRTLLPPEKKKEEKPVEKEDDIDGVSMTQEH